VVVGANGTILISSDGTEWVNRKSGETADLVGVAYGGGSYVVVGDKGTILTSANGSEWTRKASGIDGGTIGLRGVVYGGKGFVAVGGGGTIVTSADGVGWKPSASGTRNDLSAVTWCSGRYVATGALDDSEKSLKTHRRVYASPDGETWSAMSMAERLSFYGAACAGDGTVVLVGRKILQSEPLPETK